MDSKLLREKIRNNNFNQPTCGFAKDYIQTNLVIVTNDYADDFEKFCGESELPDFDFIGLHGVWSWMWATLGL